MITSSVVMNGLENTSELISCNVGSSKPFLRPTPEAG